MNEQTISTYYEIDHDRLDDLFKNFQYYKGSDLPKAKEFFRQFKIGLQRHIVWEEEILFPLFEKKTGLIDSGPTHVMRAEHRLIKKYLEAIHEKLMANNLDAENDEILLVSTLSMHNMKEERILYPAIDRSVDVAEKASIFAAMKNMPEARYDACCKDSGAVKKKS